MAKYVLVERRGHTLVPADPYSFEQLESFPEGKALNLELKTSRSRGNLNKYWAGLSVLIENLSEQHERMWPTARKYHEAMLDSLGYVYKLWRYEGKNPDGSDRHSFRNVPDSIALENMSEEDFLALWEKVRAITVHIVGYDPWTRWEEMKDAEKAGKDWRRNWREGDADE